MKKIIVTLLFVCTALAVNCYGESCWELIGDCVVSEVEDFGNGSCGIDCGSCIVEDCLPGDPQV